MAEILCFVNSHLLLLLLLSFCVLMLLFICQFKFGEGFLSFYQNLAKVSCYKSSLIIMIYLDKVAPQPMQSLQSVGICCTFSISNDIFFELR